jgi:nicotinate-nucleotide pyrophosphorylase (carboxylating)
LTLLAASLVQTNADQARAFLNTESTTMPVEPNAASKASLPSGTHIRAHVKRSLDEDVGSGDLTAMLLPDAKQGEAEVVTREDAVLCGQSWFEATFELIDRRVTVEWLAADGARLKAGSPVCRLRGPLRALLTAERTALNYLQTLSGTATVARCYADAVAGLPVRILDTRKTLPGLRLEQKYAVRCGGCHNHRMGLFDAVLIKENHIAAAGSIGEAIAAARRQAPAEVPVEIEVESLAELAEALEAGVVHVLLDNFGLADLRRAVGLNAGRARLEASGGVTLTRLRDIAETGVDDISVGDLTKSVRSIDLSMRLRADS